MCAAGRKGKKKTAFQSVYLKHIQCQLQMWRSLSKQKIVEDKGRIPAMVKVSIQ